MTPDLLTLTIFLPAAGCAALFLVKRGNAGAVKAAGLAFSLLAFASSAAVLLGFDASNPAMQFTRKVGWISSIDASYSVGVDGISLLLVVLTTLLSPLALLSSWNAVGKRVREFTMMILLLETGMLGVFCSLDLLLFYMFWEAMLIPMYFIIGIWGGERRIYAAVKFFLYTMAGSLLMLVAIIALGSAASALPGGSFTTDLQRLTAVGPGLPLALQTWMFLAFALSFAIKIPLFPFHTWLPDAHVEAPTAGSVILAGVLLKMGTYGFLRFCLPLFPHATLRFIPVLSVLAVAGIVYGALVAMVQTDMKKLVAYTSVSHLGFVVLGICSLTEEGIQGSIIQMVNHGLSTGALFLIVGMIYERRHTRMISEFGGLGTVAPALSTLFMIVTLSSIGLPGLNGFVGEFLILTGSFLSPHGGMWAAGVAATGVVLGAVTMLWMYQRVVFGRVSNPANEKLPDLSAREWCVLVPVLLLIVWIGVRPGTFLSMTAAAAKSVVTAVAAAGPLQAR